MSVAEIEVLTPEPIGIAALDALTEQWRARADATGTDFSRRDLRNWLLAHPEHPAWDALPSRDEAFVKALDEAILQSRNRVVRRQAAALSPERRAEIAAGPQPVNRTALYRATGGRLDAGVDRRNIDLSEEQQRQLRLAAASQARRARDKLIECWPEEWAAVAAGH